MLHALRSFLRAAEKGLPPDNGKERAWLEAAFRAENGKYNARESEARCDANKRGCATIGDLTAGIRAAMEGKNA